MKLIGMDVGSTTVKAVVVEDGRVTWQDYQRHNTRQAEKVFEFLERMEREGGIAGRTRSHLLHRLGRGVPCARSPAASWSRRSSPSRRAWRSCTPTCASSPRSAASDMKTIFFTATGTGPAGTDVAKSKQVFMQSACSGGTGTFVEKTARKLQVPTSGLPTCRTTARASTR
jgi:hypothetical protein